MSDVLRELQHDLAEAFRGAGGDEPAARRVLARLVPMGGVPPARSLEVYQRSLRAAVGQALAEIFPVCAELVGEDCFRAIARHYSREHASRHPDLARIGDSLPALIPQLDFLASVPYLTDVARLELAVHHAAIAADAPRVDDPESIGDALGERPDAWRLVFAPSLALIESQHPVRAIWHAHRDPVGGTKRFIIEPIEAPERLIVWRSLEGLHVEVLAKELHAIVDGVAQGVSVLRLLECGRVEGADADSELAAALAAIRSLFERSWVVGVEPLADPNDRKGLSGRCTEAPTVIEGKRRTTT